MYYRYKSKKRNKKKYKIIFIGILVFTAGYAVYSFRSYLMFWKYNYSTLDKKIMALDSVQGEQNRILMLQNLRDVCDKYKEENPLSAEAFFSAGKVHFMIGETKLSESFSELVIHEKKNAVGDDARNEFITAIKDIRKGMALVNGVDDEMTYFYLAKAGYYSDYYEMPYVFELLKKIRNTEKIKSDGDVRFYSLIYILNNSSESGIRFLKAHPRATGGSRGKLFMAAAEKMGKNFTNAIMINKDVIKTSTDPESVRIAQFNLGKIYYQKSLFNESLYHLTEASKLAEDNYDIQIWIGKSFYKAGDRKKAESIWKAVLRKDKDNDAAKKLLGGI
ncbi:MAG TPA: tetratricopeptide repeat protein [Spirochaetota bacterium]|nr:tetratricopeptide repeat protein [Spirochaetota bacterium]